MLVLKSRLDPLLKKEVRSLWACTVSDRVGICTRDLLTQKPVLLKTPQPRVFFLHPQHNLEALPYLEGPPSVNWWQKPISERLKVPDHCLRFVFITVYGI